MYRGLRLWNSWDYEAVNVYKYIYAEDGDYETGPWSSLGSHGGYVFQVVVKLEILNF